MMLHPGPPGSLPVPAGITVGPVSGTGDRVLPVADNHPFASRPEITADDRIPAWRTWSDPQYLLLHQWSVGEADRWPDASA